jgi:hypothetical protein
LLVWQQQQQQEKEEEEGLALDRAVRQLQMLVGVQG